MSIIAPDGWYDVAKNLPPGAQRSAGAGRVVRWVGGMLRFWASLNRGYTVTTMDKQDERTEIRIWDKECYLPVKIVTVHAFGRIDVRPAPDGKPDAIEFCPGGRPAGLSEESADAIKALLGRVEKSLETD